ncbi:MAG: uracil-DNA glycosylase [Syntrophaceae bacterium]|nr:uracil-DNA glycosylase [Deltaproteobacteria bacterium]
MRKEQPPKTDRKKLPADINCFACRHFFITYDQHYPYGCRAVGFKSRVMPSKEMSANSGIECQLFSAKEKNG